MNLLNWKYILIATALLAIGFFAGRWNTNTVEIIKYVKGATIHDSIEVPKPYEVKVPANPILPTRPDTVRLKGDSVYITQVVDTNRVFKEYSSEVFYKLPIFKNDTLGTLTVNEVLQYNRIKHFDYKYDPVSRISTVERKRLLVPFVVSGYTSCKKSLNIGAGVYVKNIGISVKLVPRSGYEIDTYYKF